MSRIICGKNTLQSAFLFFSLVTDFTTESVDRLIPAPEDQDAEARTISISSIAELALYGKL
jgi:hypothetical protein